ncbi:MAG: geranylgeranyl diphosphate synthase type II [Myxococcota bacterium]|jgi:geranylgeranyl diphosphate synthase type II
MTAFDLSAWLAPRRDQIDSFLLSRFGDAFPERLIEACRYPLTTGGKRMRPLLSLAAHEALGKKTTAHTLTAACAVELIHSYSLVHDDLPAMDNDDERRGKPTAHHVYGEDGAILIGDAMLTEAFALLAALPPALCGPLVAELAAAAGHTGMLGGQAMDVGMGGPVTDLATLTQLHRGKTGALIRCAVRFGALTAQADPTQLDALTRYGEAIGLAFQLADDVLDADQDAGDDGPPSFVRLLGIDETRRRAQVLLEEALSALAPLPHPQALAALARFTVERDH